MVAIKLPIFAGMVPAIDPHIMGDQHADKAVNAWLYSGALNGMPRMKQLHQMVNPNATKAFRIPVDFGDPTYLYNSRWMEFTDAHTDFISAPVAADQYKRFYWTSPSQQPVYNTLPRIIANLPPYLLGINPPDQLTVNVSGGSSTNNVSRAYLSTYVSEYGEEGAASNAVLANGKQDSTFELTVPGVAAADLGVSRNIKKIRIYRTIVSASGTVTYYQVAELDAQAGSQTYNDTLSDAILASRPILESTSWTPPPDLDGMVAMPNGIVAGFKDNELHFSEAYRPHAWPAAYSLMLAHDIVGLGVVNQTLVVCTKGNPYTASGVNPASITTSMLGNFEPCLSKGSILPTDNGVFYSSPNGIILVNTGHAQNITQQFITRDKWNEIVNRGKVNAGRFGSAYYAYGSGIQRSFQENAFATGSVQIEEERGSSEGFMVDPINVNVGYVDLKDTGQVQSIYNDVFSGEMIIAKDGKVYFLDQSPGYKVEAYIWKSKIFQTPDIRNFSAFKVSFYEPDNFQFPNPPNFSLNQEFDPDTQLCVVRIYADDRLISAQEIRSSKDIHRLPSGFKAEFWQIEIQASVKVKSFQMATSVKELARV